MKVKLPDGSMIEVKDGSTPEQIAREISESLAKRAIGAVVNGELWDLTRPIDTEEVTLKLVLDKDEDAPEFYRHTMAHIMAQAVMRIYGKERVKLGIGPTIEKGFYYDFDIEGVRLSEEDLEKIEKEMKKIIEEDLKIERFELSKEEALEMMKEANQPYKVELIEEITDEKVSFYKQGEFVDLCKGPHLPSTGRIKYFKLLSVSGAYWRGDENRPMLQRIYGTAFAKKIDLEEYLKFIEESKRRDHRRLGPQLGLFTLHPDVAPGLPFFHPKGMVVINELIEFWRGLHREAGYEEIMTPLIMHERLWRQSGHWDHFKENMYFTEKDEQVYAVKPMNCPGHIIIYKSMPVSYRDLPLRMCELGRVHRYERSGVLHGLFRVRGFTQDDAHIFCTEEQIEDEVRGVAQLTDKIYRTFGFKYHVELSTMPEDHMGSEETWEKAINALKRVLDSMDIDYVINEGEGAFYGPKIDYHIEDSLGRPWQCATIQLDFMMPERFDLKYMGPDNVEHRPVMIHRAIYGSLERFLGILIEHFAGAFPTWLAPVQVMIIPIADRHNEYAQKIKVKLEEANLRVDVDTRSHTTSYKVREAQMMKIPYMLILGDREMEHGTVALRLRSGKDLGQIKLDAFIENVKKEIEGRMLTSIFETEE
ncbi:MAG: threonine--tRNA ligase [Thermotogae bacterium]|nr:threonine--tRNA ligase [Thermotogota bacterium]